MDYLAGGRPRSGNGVQRVALQDVVDQQPGPNARIDSTRASHSHQSWTLTGQPPRLRRLSSVAWWSATNGTAMYSLVVLQAPSHYGGVHAGSVDCNSFEVKQQANKQEVGAERAGTCSCTLTNRCSSSPAAHRTPARPRRVGSPPGRANPRELPQPATVASYASE